MRTFIIIIFLLGCNVKPINIEGHWATIDKNGFYYEILIDKNYIQFIDNSGVLSNKYKYLLNKNVIDYPFHSYNIKRLDENNLLFYNSKDSLYLEKIMIKSYSLNNFIERKYSFLVTNNYISVDSANKAIRNYYNKKKEDVQIKELNLNYLLKKSFIYDTLKNKK